MRSNLPVTQREHHLPAGTTLMSTTDVKGTILFASPAFVAASGYERDELIGQPHNIVRHPDMPEPAFGDMWATLQRGRSWTGIVKNRRKNGDHYWVRANVTPMYREGALMGYMSVRNIPSRAEVEATDRLYQAMRQGTAGRIRIHQGLVLPTGLLAPLSLAKTMSIRWRMRLTYAAMAVAATGVATLFGLRGADLATFLGAAAVGCAVVGVLTDHYVCAPLERVMAQAMQVASGQSVGDVHLDRIDEIGVISRSIGQCGLTLHSIVGDVSEQVAAVRVASSEIAAGNGDLSMRTEQTASSLEETAASMEQMTVTLRNNVDSVREADALASAASQAAAEGGEAVGAVVGTMQGISAASRRIADIVGVIDGIAFQTNLLALNAAVEAARAGSQGRGFAVVAAEVRSLANRSAEAAREIKALIDDSASRVESGASQADAAGRTMTDIVERVRRVQGLISEITNATAEQSQGIAQVSTAVTQLDHMTQQNAALVEQTAAAAASMSGQAERLAEAIEVFV